MNLDFYKRRAERTPHLAPRFHAGIGMIQLHLRSKDDRLHIWHPEQRATRPDSDIHNHKFSFSSVVIKGLLGQEIIVPGPGDDLNLWTTFCDGQEPAKLVGTVSVYAIEKRVVSPNDEYFMEAGRFHRTKVLPGALVVTRMQKYWDNPAQVVQVIAKKDVRMDHAFSNDLPRPSIEKMWELIADATSDMEVG